MMREILFRAWHKSAGFMSDTFDLFTASEMHQKFDLERSIVMQFTGLTDKNGVKIFEGDILRFDVRASFEEDSRPQTGCIGQVNIGSRETSFGCWDSAYCHNLLVIGNTHQSPELLK
jgi:uncharacterized phage protein (TIGR01671 family)